MNEKLIQQIKEIEETINKLESQFNMLKSSSTIPYDIYKAFLVRLQDLTPELPDGFEDAPLAAITAPVGGATVDSPSRTAINDIITTLENLGLIEPN